MGSKSTRGPLRPAPSPWRHALIPASLVVCFVLVYQLRVAPWWVAVVGVVAAGMYLVAPSLGRRSMARFDRDAVRLLSENRAAALPARYAKAVGMRLFAPPALVAERKGLVCAETARPGLARAAYRKALDGYPEDRAPLGVQLGIAHASFALGDDVEAIRRYRAVLRNAGSYPRVDRNLAHALARRGEDLAEAEALAERALNQAGDNPSPELRLVCALVHARRGQRRRATTILRSTEGASGPPAQRLREEVAEALEEP